LEYTWAEITGELSYILFAQDTIWNNTTINFTIDKTPPTSTIEYSNTW
jgi:hypothetical protein